MDESSERWRQERQERFPQTQLAREAGIATPMKSRKPSAFQMRVYEAIRRMPRNGRTYASIATGFSVGHGRWRERIDACIASVLRIRSLSVMKSSDSNFGYTRREAFRLGMSSLAAVWFGSPLVSALAQTTITPAPTGPYTLPPLPYSYEALEPQIDTLTMQVHHDKHHKAYVDNANKLLADQPELAKLSPEDLLKNLSEAPEAIRTGLRNNVGGGMSITPCFGR